MEKLFNKEILRHYNFTFQGRFFTVYVLDGDKIIKILDSKILTDVIFTRKKYYISDEMDILWEVNNKGKVKKSLGNTEIYILVE